MPRKGYHSLTLEDQESDFKGEIRFLTDDIDRIREAIKQTHRADENHILSFNGDYQNNTPIQSCYSLHGLNGTVEFLVNLIHRMKVPVEYASRKGPITWGFFDKDLEYQRLAWNHAKPSAPMDFNEQLDRRKQQQLFQLLQE